MGNSLCDCTQSSKQKLIIYGDYINSDCRTIMNILDCCNITYEVKFVDSIAKNDKNQKNLMGSKEDPANCLPMVIHGNFKMISNNKVENIIKYL